jgi:hypothetical protein
VKHVPQEDEPLFAYFEEFATTRLVLEPGSGKVVEAPVYNLIIGVQGTVNLNNMPLLPEQGFYVPACVKSLTISNSSTDQATILITQPTVQDGNKS